MPWLPELFSAPVLQHMLDERRRTRLAAVPYFDGLLSDEPDALVASFAREPELHDPVHGRVKGDRAFRAFIAEQRAWLERHHVTVEDVEHVVLERNGFEELVLHLDRGDLRLVIVAEREPDGHIDELRLYHGGGDGRRAPLLQPDPDLRVPAAIAAQLPGLEPCAMVDGGRACAVEYVHGAPPAAGVAVVVRDENGEVAAARRYDSA